MWKGSPRALFFRLFVSPPAHHKTRGNTPHEKTSNFVKINTFSRRIVTLPGSDPGPARCLNLDLVSVPLCRKPRRVETPPGLFKAHALGRYQFPEAWAVLTKCDASTPPYPTLTSLIVSAARPAETRRVLGQSGDRPYPSLAGVRARGWEDRCTAHGKVEVAITAPYIHCPLKLCPNSYKPVGNLSQKSWPQKFSHFLGLDQLRIFRPDWLQKFSRSLGLVLREFPGLSVFLEKYIVFCPTSVNRSPRSKQVRTQGGRRDRARHSDLSRSGTIFFAYFRGARSLRSGGAA